MDNKARGLEKVRADARYASAFFPEESLRLFLDNRHRLCRLEWNTGDQRCFLGWLSVGRDEGPITTAPDLTRFITGMGSGHPYKELLQYQPVRRVIRFIAGQMDPETAAYYEGATFESWDLFLEVVEDVLKARLGMTRRSEVPTDPAEYDRRVRERMGRVDAIVFA